MTGFASEKDGTSVEGVFIAIGCITYSKVSSRDELRSAALHTLTSSSECSKIKYSTYSTVIKISFLM
jgi:hypothetical protein